MTMTPAPKPPLPHPATEPVEPVEPPAPTEAEIDEALDESFPASDPPGYSTPHPMPPD